MNELLSLVSEGRLPYGDSYTYNPSDPLERVSNAIRQTQEFATGDLPKPRWDWRQCWLRAFQDRWEAWNIDEAQAELHLAALEARMFAGVRAAETPPDHCERMLGFLNLLGSPDPGPFQADQFHRYLPGAAGPDWADEVLRQGEAQTQAGPCQEVLFPGVWANSEPGLLRARVTRLPGAAAPGEPRLLLAAWSTYLIRQPDVAHLIEQFGRIAADHLSNSRFLLELVGLHEGVLVHRDYMELKKLSPPGFLVTGGSLGLAVLLAAWAADQQPEILPLIATGELLDGAIGPVEAVADKSRIVAEFLMRGNCHTFLVPMGNKDEVIATLPDRFPNHIETVEPQVSILFSQTMKERLTDGCQAYRNSLLASEDAWTQEGAKAAGTGPFGVIPQDDLQELDRVAADLLLQKAGTQRTMALPFGCQPRLATLYLLRWLARQTQGGRPIVLPLLISEEAEDSTPRQRLVERIKRGLADVGENYIAVPTLRNLLGTFGDWLLLIAYGKTSRELQGHHAERQRWLEVQDDLKSVSCERKPRLLVLASDWHHLECLCPESAGKAHLFPCSEQPLQ